MGSRAYMITCRATTAASANKGRTTPFLAVRRSLRHPTHASSPPSCPGDGLRSHARAAQIPHNSIWNRRRSAPPARPPAQAAGTLRNPVQQEAFNNPTPASLADPTNPLSAQSVHRRTRLLVRYETTFSGHRSSPHKLFVYIRSTPGIQQ